MSFEGRQARLTRQAKTNLRNAMCKSVLIRSGKINENTEAISHFKMLLIRKI